MAKTFWHIQNCSIFARLDNQQLQTLELRSRVRKFPKGTSIYLPTDAADAAFLVGEGRVRLCSTTPEGKQSILAFIEPGELFGELAVVDGTT
ncbi:MAG: cyclic nucleotide-binding domain-containing protein [Pirellulaceae bacterium]